LLPLLTFRSSFCFALATVRRLTRSIFGVLTLPNSWQMACQGGGGVDVSINIFFSKRTRLRRIGSIGMYRVAALLNCT
jgi:hypothetical protein